MKILTPLALAFVIVAVAGFASPAIYSGDTSQPSVDSTQQTWIVICHYPDHEGDVELNRYSKPASATVYARVLNRADVCSQGGQPGQAIVVSEDGWLNGHGGS